MMACAPVEIGMIRIPIIGIEPKIAHRKKELKETNRI